MLSNIGFGHQPFGSEAFGSSDWAEQVTWRILPQYIKDLDSTNPGLVNAPLRGFINSIKPLFEEIRIKYQLFPNLWDAYKCPFPQLAALAYNIGINITSIQTLGMSNVVTTPFTIGETVKGSQSLSLGTLTSTNADVFSISGINGSGYISGETLTGLASGKSVKIISVSGATPTQQLTVQTFIIGEKIKGSSSGTRGIVGTVSQEFLNVDTVTGLGFQSDESIIGETSGASSVINSVKIDGRSEALLRSQVLNATQLWLNKGVNKSYKIVAAFENLKVEVTPLWSNGCQADPNGELLTPTEVSNKKYLSYWDIESADILPLDRLFDSPTDAWPHDVDNVEMLPGLPDGQCRSHSVDLFFYTENNTEIEDFDSVSNRIVSNIEQFRPIHINFRNTRFSGPTAASEPWYFGPIYAENSATATFVTDISVPEVVCSTTWNLQGFSANN